MVYDSAYYSVNTLVERQIAMLLCSQEKNNPLHFINTQMQCGGADCGIFAIAFATALAFGIQPELLTLSRVKCVSTLSNASMMVT